jgi:hypothetical protein
LLLLPPLLLLLLAPPPLLLLLLLLLILLLLTSFSTALAATPSVATLSCDQAPAAAFPAIVCRRRAFPRAGQQRRCVCRRGAAQLLS